MNKKIKLGDIRISCWKRNSRLFSRWFYERAKTDEKYAEKIKECDPKEIILPPNQNFTLKITYPLSVPYKCIFDTKNGMTRRQVVDLIVKSYKKIYKEENKTSSIKEALGKDIGSVPYFNRIKTNGKHGIWGHVLSDLILCSLDIKKNNVLEVLVES